LVLFWVFLNEKGEEEAFLSQFSRWKKKIIAAAKDQIWTHVQKREHSTSTSRRILREGKLNRLFFCSRI
jgi:hypothetical protein